MNTFPKNNYGSQYNTYDTVERSATVTIPYDGFISLIRKERKLDALLDAGVEKWEGYDQAMESLE